MPPELTPFVPHQNPALDHRVSPWLDEQIWGHRIWDAQSPWLLFLEFLTVAEAHRRDGKLLVGEADDYPLTYCPYRRMHLRNILFNHGNLQEIAGTYPDSATAWEAWLSWMEDNAAGVNIRKFSYLKSRFHTFHAFADTVAMLRGSAVEAESNRRWTSQFVFPFGPYALYEDLNLTPNNAVSREYINFGRTGELLYLMLCRCADRDALRPLLDEMIGRRSSWDALLRLLQPDEDRNVDERGKSYLPYASLPAFNSLGKDWLNVLRLGLPGYDAYAHLVLLGAFHILLYQLHCAAQWAAPGEKVVFICEVVAPKKTLVRELGFSNFAQNNVISARALEACIDDVVTGSEWLEAVAEPDSAFERCESIFRKRFMWPSDRADYEGPAEPAGLVAELRSVALRRHRQHAGNVHRNYGRWIGLISKRGTTKYRYAPNDGFLKTLIVANVQRRCELHEFLHLLYERYGLVFGDREAEEALASDDFDKKAFQANARRLEERLRSMGLLRRLSDACAYVENPLSEGRNDRC